MVQLLILLVAIRTTIPHLVLSRQLEPSRSPALASTRGLAVLSACVPCGSPAAGESTAGQARVDSLPKPVWTEAVTTLIGLFERFPIVALGEIHRSAGFHRLLARLVTTPAFRAAVDDIVVEFGNSRYQALIDRYVRGEVVPFDSLRLVWRNTTQLLVWDSPLYERFFQLVRAESVHAAGGKQLRVILGEPPIDWDRVRSTAEFPHDYGYRDPDTFRLLEQEVLARGRKALVIIGDAHLVKHDPSSAFRPRSLTTAGLGDAVTQKYPGKSFLVWSVDGGSDHLASQMSDWPSGTMARLGGTSLGALGSKVLFGESVTVFRMVNGKRVPVQLADSEFPRMEAQVDAILYVGPSAVRVPASLSNYADQRYVAELRRRGEILAPIFGIDIKAELDSLVAQARRQP